MLKAFCKFLFRSLGWTGNNFVIPDKKCILLGVPHTSIWDFVISWIYYTSLGGKMNFMIKKSFFFWPMGVLMRSMGGIPVNRSKGANVIKETIRAFNENEVFRLAITPEGTRKRVKTWKSGFHSIAKAANVPVYYGSFDWGRKHVEIVREPLQLHDDPREDIKFLKDFFREKGVKGKHPELFCTDI